MSRARRRPARTMHGLVERLLLVANGVEIAFLGYEPASSLLGKHILFDIVPNVVFFKVLKADKIHHSDKLETDSVPVAVAVIVLHCLTLGLCSTKCFAGIESLVAKNALFAHAALAETGSHHDAKLKEQFG